MSELDLNKLKQYRDEILKAEIGALLFNLGKTHIGFWKEKKENNQRVYQYFNVDDESFKNIFGFKPFTKYRKYYEEDGDLGKSPFEHELEKYNLKDFIFNKKVRFPFDIDNNKNEITWVSFFKGDALADNEDGKKFIDKIFFKGCENINSGIDKGSPNKQLEPPLWLSNAFGGFKEKIKEENFDQRRRCFFSNLERFLQEKAYLQNPNWQEIRNFVLKEIKDWYSHILSDSRFPINDITLFDQAYMTASMFKAVLAQLVMDNSKSDTYEKNPSSIKWRILGIQYDKMGLAEKGFKLASIKWYREISKEIDEEIKKLLEVKYPIGNEIYRDETGIYFIVGEDLGEDTNSGIAKLKSNLNELENKIFKIFDKCLKGEVYPYISLTKASRGLMNLSTLLEKAKENFLKRKTDLIKVQKQELEKYFLKKKVSEIEELRNYPIDENTEFILKKDKEKVPKKCEKEEELEYNFAIGVCPICQVRLIFKSDKCKNNSPTICEICDSRIHHNQVASWIGNISGETIWIDEIKDKNNRVAYISLKFELEDWLSGDLLNSLLERNMDYKKSLLKTKKFILMFLSKSYTLNIDTSNIDNKINEIIRLLRDSPLPRDQKKELGEKKSQLETQKRKTGAFLKLIQEIKEDNWWENKINTKYSFSGYTNKTIDEMIEELNKIVEEINIPNLDKIYNPFQELSPDAYNGCKINDETFDDFIQQVFFSSIVGTKWEIWIKQTPLNSKIDWQEEKIKWEKFTDENDPALDILATLLLQFLLRKNPSPARLRRIWETTQEFFEKIHKKLDTDLEIPVWRRKRLVWEVECSKLKGEKSQELEGSNLLFWMEKIMDEDLSNLSKAEKEEKLRQSKKAKIYLISSIADFIEKFGGDELKEKLNKKEIDLNDIKQFLQRQNFDLNLRKYSESKNKGEGDVLITLNSDSLSDIHSYEPYSLITDISPINYQVIIPAEYLPRFVDKVIEQYNNEFKYVYGKLPIHIGIVVANYKRPLYVNLKALRKIRRDVKYTEKLWINEDTGKFCQLQREKLSYSTTEEERNNTKDYYALYFDNKNEKDYNFYIKSSDNWKYWISTFDKFPVNSKVKIIPNTFDFEFMDANTRRNDIYYEENKHYKRVLKLKSNRPYELEVYWNKFKVFYELFKEKTNTAKMHKLVSLFYDKLQNYDERYNSLLASAIINVLELKKNKDAKRYISQIFDLDENASNFQEELSKKLNEEKLKLFIDMFEFWHTALKEV